jgi:hypothetical protein
MPIILIICAVYILFMSCLWNTHSILAAILLKFIPFCCVIALLLYAMNEFGWVQIF